MSGANLLQVLAIYREMSGRELVVSSDVRKVRAGITVSNTVEIGRSEALKLIERALWDQAGIVLTRLDDHTTSVTYNDALPAAINNSREGGELATP